MLVLAGRAVGAPAGAEPTLRFVVELGPLLAGGLPVLLDRSELAAVVEEGDVMADDVLAEGSLWRRRLSKLSDLVDNQWSEMGKQRLQTTIVASPT